MSMADEQQSWTPTFERLYHSYQRYNELRRKDDAIKERFNDLQTKLQELDALHRPSKESCRTTTPSSRDSGVPPVSSSSPCSSSTSESVSTHKSSIELPFDPPSVPAQHSSVVHFFLHPPRDNRRHVSVHLDEDPTAMSYVHDSIPRYQSHGRSVHWDDSSAIQPSPRRSSSQQIFQEEEQQQQREIQRDYYNSDPAIVKKRGQRISLNASLPFDSKLNIRIHANRVRRDDGDNNNIREVKATATIEPLDPQREHEHVVALERAYREHYATASPNDSLRTMMTSSPTYQRESRRDKLPQHRQVSLPVSLPIDQRLCLYIRNGEVLARC